MKAIVFNSALCNGCYNCQLACKDEHVANEWLPFAKPQPELGHFWCRIKETDHGQIPKVRVEYQPIMCGHCDNAVCMEKYPEAFYRTEDGFVILDPEKAGDKGIVDACPYGVIFWNDEIKIAQKCTGCAHLVAEGKLPHCVDLCYTEALRFGEEEDFGDELEGAEVLPTEGGARVYYINMPHFFIAGDVWDPITNDIIEGAKVTLTGAAEAETVTDDFGDFWFKKLDAGKYTVTVEAAGYEPMTKEVDLDKSLNIGDFPLAAIGEFAEQLKAYKEARDANVGIHMAGSAEAAPQEIDAGEIDTSALGSLTNWYAHDSEDDVIEDTSNYGGEE